jgi:histidinol-phosphatase (PHP family)
LNRVTAFDADAEKACRDICAAAARLDIPLEYNMAGLTLQDRPDGSLGYTRDEFWRIAAEYPVKAIMGCDAHAPSELDVVPAIEEKKAFLHSLGIPVLDTLPGLE